MTAPLCRDMMEQKTLWSLSLRIQTTIGRLWSVPACAKLRCQHWSSSPNITIFFTCQQSIFTLNRDLRTCDLSEMTHSWYLWILVLFMVVDFVRLFSFVLGLGHWEGESPLALTPDRCRINAPGVTNIISVLTNTWRGGGHEGKSITTLATEQTNQKTLYSEKTAVSDWGEYYIENWLYRGHHENKDMVRCCQCALWVHNDCIRKIKNVGHTVHIIVSWPNPKQWVIVHTSDLMMIIKQSIYILSVITRGMDMLKTHSPTYCIMDCIMDNWENMLNLTHTPDKIYLTGIL